jgi:hypothetical protein
MGRENVPLPEYFEVESNRLAYFRTVRVKRGGGTRGVRAGIQEMLEDATRYQVPHASMVV